MKLFELTDTLEEFKCASSQKKTFIDPNGGKIEICAKWGSQPQCEVINTPKYLWSSGYKMPITLSLVPPNDKFVEEDTVEFKAGADDFSFKAEWTDVAPVPKPVQDGFGETSINKPLSSIQQQAVDLKYVIDQNNLILALLSDIANK